MLLSIYYKRIVIGGTLNTTPNTHLTHELCACLKYRQVMCEQIGVSFHSGTVLTDDLIEQMMEIYQ